MLLEHPSILFALSELCFSHHYNTQWKNLKQSLDVIPSIYLSSNHTPPLANRIFLTNFLIDLLKFSRMDIWTVVLKSLDETNWPLQKGCSSTNDGVAKQVRADSGIEMMTVSSSHTAKEVVAVAGGDKLKQPNSRLFSSKFGRMSSNPVSNISKSWRRQSNPPNLQQREDKEKETAKEETIAEPMYITSLSPSVYSNTLFRAWLIEFEACALERFKEWSGHTRKSREVFNFLANGTYIWQKIVPAISSLMGDEIVCGDMAIEYLVRRQM